MKEPSKSSIGIDGFQRNAAKNTEIGQAFATTFGTASGEVVLKYLRSVTIEMVNGPQATDGELRHHEGQRYIVGLMERWIDHGHRSKK